MRDKKNSSPLYHTFNGQYLQLLGSILNNGERVHNRTGHDTLTLRDPQTLKIDVSKDFPMLTSKYVPYHLVLSELLWFIRAGKNVKDLHTENNHIWDLWADHKGDLGPVYGVQWRNFTTDSRVPGVDQFTSVIELIKAQPDTRQAIVTAWNPAVTPVAGVSNRENIANGKQVLPPCHWAFKLRSYAEKNGKRTLNMTAYMRSCDVPIGLPFNAPSYATLLIMFAQQLNMNVGILYMVLEDVHIYDKDNHIEMAKKQLNVDPIYPPTLVVSKASSMDAYTKEDFTLSNYVYITGIKYDSPAV